MSNPNSESGNKRVFRFKIYLALNKFSQSMSFKQILKLNKAFK